MNIVKVIDKRVNFYSQNSNLLPPYNTANRFWFQETKLRTTLSLFDGYIVLLHCFITLKHELSGKKAYEDTSEDEKSVACRHYHDVVLK